MRPYKQPILPAGPAVYRVNDRGIIRSSHAPFVYLFYVFSREECTARGRPPGSAQCACVVVDDAIDVIVIVVCSVNGKCLAGKQKKE